MPASDPRVTGKMAPAYRAILQSLLANRWPVLSRIKPHDLAEDLGMSITPIREALQRLEYEQLLSYTRNRGYFVKEFEAKEQENCCELIRAIVGYTIRRRKPQLSSTPSFGLPTFPPSDAPKPEINAFAVTLATKAQEFLLYLAALSNNEEIVRVIRVALARTYVITVLDLLYLKHARELVRAIRTCVRKLKLPEEATDAFDDLDKYFAGRVARAQPLAEIANKQSGSVSTA